MKVLAILLSFCLFFTRCQADFDFSIYSNLTADAITNGHQLVGYIQDPNGRGTTSLVVSCLLTLVLCVWSALHLNVPPRDQSRWQALWLNVRWIVAGIYAPELVVFTAWRQWCSARLLQQLVLKLAKENEGNPEIVKRYARWTMAHSFFACTGGFVFELEALDHVTLNGVDVLLDRPQRLTITARGVAILAKCGHLPTVRKEEIEDKSKANDLAKATVLVQAIWMLVQVAGRLASHLPVTPLEVNTVAHVLCAFLMYMFWWNKPLLPNEPIILEAEQLGPLAAFMYSSSEMSGYVSSEQVKSQTVVKTLLAHLNLYPRTPEFEAICLRLPNTCNAAKTPTVEVSYTIAEPVESEHSHSIPSPDTMEHDVDNVRCVHLKAEQLVADHVQNWPSNDLLHNVDGLVVGMVLWLANFCYGGIHAAAWNEHFPSEAEMWLWRASAVYIGFCGGLRVVLNFIVARVPALNQFWEHWMGGKKTWWQSFSLGINVFVCGLSLVLAHMFIVIEAVISIRELPASAYETPQWTDLFPHL
ncbi:Uu.00g005270.m01.CDS01 [Anthostomella pinea]|uniref:Uu.00g005270.m01.CDS01 n=1 Tax=Anthostomella pinea TaxID=933095 RepID=A0AAI8VKQ7_9PEZI|nr:Uu.00g005270.m01.CDS01 [Anthostomella pinea]